MKKSKLLNQSLELGCGLIRIGRVWGVKPSPIPNEKEAQEFLEKAYALGIRFFDTAPSYGLSEQRLGKFLENLSAKQLETVTIATKFGEHWDEEKGEPYIDHTYDALMFSLEKSRKHLGKIDILQLHKASQILLEDEGVTQAFEQAKSDGIPHLGLSISDVDTGICACHDNRFSFIQLPFNEEKKELLPVINEANAVGKRVIFNRPFAMGSIIMKSPKPKEELMENAYALVFHLQASGIVLTGTASIAHLQENISTFMKEKYE